MKATKAPIYLLSFLITITTVSCVNDISESILDCPVLLKAFQTNDTAGIKIEIDNYLSGLIPQPSSSDNGGHMKTWTWIYLFILIELVYSCATLINSDSQRVFIAQDTTVDLIIQNKYSFSTSKNESPIPVDLDQDYFYFHRCKESITLINMKELDTFNLYPHKSYFLYWFGNIYTTYGLGMLIDNRNNRKYEYRKFNYFTRGSDGMKNTRFEPISQNKLKINIAVPYINNFVLLTHSGKTSATGFWGFSIGADYFLSNNRYISTNLGAATDFPIPVPAAIDIYGEWESSSILYGNIRINKSTPYFEFGTGFSFAHLKWETAYNGSDSVYNYIPAFNSSLNLGISSSIQYRFTPAFKIGFIYQPYFINLNTNKLQYQHFFSTELIWRF